MPTFQVSAEQNEEEAGSENRGQFMPVPKAPGVSPAGRSGASQGDFLVVRPRAPSGQEPLS